MPETAAEAASALQTEMVVEAVVARGTRATVVTAPTGMAMPARASVARVAVVADL
jgi:hypothetical protein